MQGLPDALTMEQPGLNASSHITRSDLNPTALCAAPTGVALPL